MKKSILAVVLTAGLLLAMLALPASAATATEPGAPEDYGKTWAYYGDLNNDQKANAADALTILRVSVNKQTLSETQKILADVTADKAVNAADALDVLRASVGKLTVFKAGHIYSWGEVTPPQPPTGNPIVDYDKSNSVNGAYEEDESADTSCHVDVSSIRPNTLYRVNGNTTDVDNLRLLVSLQGLINRDFGMDTDHTSLVYLLRDESDADWYDYMTGKRTEAGEVSSVFNLATPIYGQDDAGNQMVAGYQDDGLVPVSIRSFTDFLTEFMGVIRSCGIVLWDGNVPATANVAATICGLEGYLPVLADSPLHQELLEANVPVKLDLTGMFHDGEKGQPIAGTSIQSTGSAKNDAYLWALEKYFDRCSSTYLGYTLDGAVTIKGYDAYEDNPTALLSGANIHCLTNMDYLIARRAFCFDLAVYKGEAACDDPAQQSGKADPGTDHETMIKIFAARYKRAGGAFGQVLGFPPWWVKYTTHNNQGSQGNVWNEWLFTEYITCYNLAKEADAQAPASMTNGSAYYKYVPMKAKYTNDHSARNVQFNSDAFYYMLYVGDYDSSAWMKQHVYNMWMRRGGDAARGQIPLMWSFNPNLSYRLPVAFDYVHEFRTVNDYFAAGDSGAGYVMPSALMPGVQLPYAGQTRPAENGSAAQAWIDYCKVFYDRFDLDITGFIINGAIFNVPKNVADCFNKISPVGSLTNCHLTPLGINDGVPYVFCYNQVTPGQSEAMYNYATNTMRGFNFGAYRTICQTPTQMYQIVTQFDKYAAEKGFKTEYCDPYTYFKLIRESGQGTVIQ